MATATLNNDDFDLTPTPASPAPKPSKAFKGFKGARCPYCLDGDSYPSVDLGDLSITCGSCGETFTAAAAVELLRKQVTAWTAVAKWIESARDVAALTSTE